jgi:hypothetical protein
MIAIVPLEDIFHACGFLVELVLPARVLRLKLWQILLNQVELDHLLVVASG